MLRPESLAIGPVGSAPGPSVMGRIRGMAFMGNHTRVTVSTAAGALVVHRLHGGGAGDGDQEGQIDEEACVWWAPTEAIVMAATEVRA